MSVLQRAVLKHILPDTTHVLERNGKDAFVYLGRDGAGHMLLDDGERRSGRWTLLDDGYATEWSSGQKGDWQIESSADGLTYVSRDGAVRLKMRGILFGNPKGLS